MAIQYANRRGDVYHLQAGKRRGGGIGYSFSRKPAGAPVDEIPEGYEIYESPENAQVFLRKARPSAILASEKQLAEATVRRLATGRHCIVEADGNALVIWLADSGGESLVEDLADMFPFPISVDRKRAVVDGFARQARYTKVFRFEFEEGESRHFCAQRWCFLGSIDSWVFLDGGKSLAKLLEKYVPHLGKESFFELM